MATPVPMKQHWWALTQGQVVAEWEGQAPQLFFWVGSGLDGAGRGGENQRLWSSLEEEAPKS